jgi:DNA-binding IclR family transcriptional regulator
MASLAKSEMETQLAPWEAAKASRPERTVKSAERTLALFELFSLHQDGLSVGQIASMLDIPQPSVTMLVRNLVALGYLEHDRPTRTYLPTIRVMLLGTWIHRRFQLQNDLEGNLDRVMRKCDETVVLGVRNSLYCQYVCALIPDQPNHLEIQSGMVRPLTKTAVGQILLSNLPDHEVALLVRRCNAEFEPHLRVNQNEFMELIDRVRTLGYAETAGDMTPGRGVIAVAIPTPVGKMPMAAGIGVLMDRMPAKRSLILESLLELQANLTAPASAERDRSGLAGDGNQLPILPVAAAL